MDVVAALDFGGTKIALATATPAGEILEQARIDTEPAQGAQRALARAMEAALTLLARTGGRCLAVGAVCPGLPREDRVLLAPNVPGWGDLAFEREIRAGLGVERVAVRNDVKAAAEAELRWGALRGADPAVFLSLGTGIAATIAAGGRVLEGAHGASGELAYVLSGADEDAAFADGHAPLEERAGGRFVGERASAVAGRALTAAEAFASDDPRVAALVDATLDELAVHVANLATLVDPERIAVGGGLMGSPDRVLGAIRRRLDRAAPFPPELVAARFVHDGALRGALALALDVLGAPQADERHSGASSA
jgi:glucokinase